MIRIKYGVSIFNVQPHARCFSNIVYLYGPNNKSSGATKSKTDAISVETRFQQ